MGAGQSKDELLYQEVANNNQHGVRALHRHGARLEWIDKDGRTPLILACTRGELLDMAITLLDLGANINSYRPGSHRGFPLHHAAKRGLEKTVTLLLSRGANPLAINDDGNTPLDMARSRGHVSVVRLLEEHLCLFSGMLREISGFGLLETLVPNLVTKKIWGVVLPCEFHPARAPKYEFAVYQSPKMAQPRTIISLAKADIEEPKFNSPDPVLYITEKANKTKYKFLSDVEGDKPQLERLYKACRGIPWVSYLSYGIGLHEKGEGLSNLMFLLASNFSLMGQSINSQQSGRPTPSAEQPVERPSSVPSPVTPATASSASNPHQINDYPGWDVPEGSYNGWGPPDLNKQEKKPPKETSYGGWAEETPTYNGWGPAEAGTSTSQTSPSIQESPSVSVVQPSAPPLPDGPILYPSIEIGTETGSGLVATKIEEQTGGMCVVCWDAKAEGACVPCGHLAGCMSCLSEIQAKKWGCPVCREQIHQVIKVYTV